MLVLVFLGVTVLSLAAVVTPKRDSISAAAGGINDSRTSLSAGQTISAAGGQYTESQRCGSDSSVRGVATAKFLCVVDRAAKALRMMNIHGLPPDCWPIEMKRICLEDILS